MTFARENFLKNIQLEPVGTLWLAVLSLNVESD